MGDCFQHRRHSRFPPSLFHVSALRESVNYRAGRLMAYIAAGTEYVPARVLVCGGRDFSDRAWLYRVLDGVHNSDPFLCVIQGGARGADSLAALWAKDRCVPLITFFANWNAHGKAAGALRNQQMLDVGKPTLVIGFPGGRGTADMMRRAKALPDMSWMEVSRERRAASVGRNPEGEDREDGLRAEHEHAVPNASEADAHD
jgi:hypothetical protein